MEEEEGGGDQGSSLSLREKTRCSNAQIHRPKEALESTSSHGLHYHLMANSSYFKESTIFERHYFREVFSWINL